MTFEISEVKDNFTTRVVNRLDKDAVGLDPFTLFTIVASVLNLLLQAWNVCTPHTTVNNKHARLAEECQNTLFRNQLIRRTARQIRRNTPVTKTQAIQIASATVEEALAMNSDCFNTLATVCGEYPQAEKLSLYEEV